MISCAVTVQLIYVYVMQKVDFLMTRLIYMYETNIVLIDALKSNEKAMNRDWDNKKIPFSKPK